MAGNGGGGREATGERDGSALAGRGADLVVAAEELGAVAQAREALALGNRGGVHAAAVVGDLEGEGGGRRRKTDTDVAGGGVADDVVKRFLEREEEVALASSGISPVKAVASNVHSTPARRRRAVARRRSRNCSGVW
jgi:hypothetical protein